MSNELLPCPFCGGEADQVLTDYEQVQVEEVRCRDCWATVGGATEAAAILAWNTRPAPSSRMADVRLGAEAALKLERLFNACILVTPLGDMKCTVCEKFTPAAKRADRAKTYGELIRNPKNHNHDCQLMLAATVTLPAIQKNERSTDAFQCPSCGAAIKAPPRSNEKTLRRYGWHDESCPDYPTRTRPIGLCNCGFLSALASKETDRG